MKSLFIFFLKKYLNIHRSFQTIYNNQLTYIEPAKNVNLTTYEKNFLEKSYESYHYGNDYSFGFKSKPIFYLELNNVELQGNTGLILYNNMPILESAYSQTRMQTILSLPYFFLHSKRKYGLHTSFFLLPWAENNIYHWLIDALPRITILKEIEKVEFLYIIIPQGMPKYQQETLQAIINYLGKRIELVEIKKNNRFYIDKYLFLPPVSDDGNGFLPNKIINIMRNSIFKYYEINFRQEGYRKIYLSRSKSSKRRILNEDEFYLILKNKGFELIHAEDLSFKEQVKLFSESAFIIGVHGAGLTNILFCPNNCKLIELHPSNVVRSHYMLLAKSLNLYYQYEVGTISNENDDFYIIIDDFNTEYL